MSWIVPKGTSPTHHFWLASKSVQLIEQQLDGLLNKSERKAK